MEIYTAYPRKGNKAVRLTAYINPPGPREPEGTCRPGIIILPGGAYRSCTKHTGEGDSAAMAFASEGYQAFVLEYSVGRGALFPAQIEDYASSVKLIRDNADKWNTDIKQISVLGFSAGGHLAGMVATAWHRPEYASSAGLEPENIKPLCAMLIYGVLDYKIQNDFRKSCGGSAEMNLFTLGMEDPPDELLCAYSPTRLVSEKTCPVFLATARNDSMVPAEETLEMAFLLSECKVPYELHMFENGDHLFALGQYRDQPWRDDRKYTAAAWLTLAKKFVQRRAAPDSAKWDELPLGEIKRTKDK